MNRTGLEIDVFGKTAEGEIVERYTLRNSRGVTIRLITYGATVTELWTPDRQGGLADVVLGFDDLRSYETLSPYFGCLVGRVAFRIVGGEFLLDGTKHRLSLNDGPNHLHGGVRGFHRVVWRAEPISTGSAPAVKFTHRSPDGNEGYPGTLDVAAVFSLSDENEMQIELTARTDQATLVNLTHHSYFNLAGAGRGNVLDHRLQIDADRWIVVGQPDVPTGEIAAVYGTPFDFTRPTAVGARLHNTGGDPPGYDHCYLLNHPEGKLARAAEVHEPRSGRMMEVSTTEPALVFYTGNFLDGTLRGKGGALYPRHAGLCLETSRPPDAIHHPHFPSIVLRPGQRYDHRCVYRFSTT
jgi:aldose 1-epimerase